MIAIDKKPKCVIVCGHEVKVFYRKKLSADGFFHPDRDEIQIKNNETWKQTLLHEILHAILFYSGHSQSLDEKLEEAIVMALENGFKCLILI